MNNTDFGKQLRELRKSKGFTQQVLAEKAGIDEKHLSRIETGKYFPSYGTLNKLLSALELSLEESGFQLEQPQINKNPLLNKALHILNSARNDDELVCYIEALKVIQKTIKIKN